MAQGQGVRGGRGQEAEKGAESGEGRGSRDTLFGEVGLRRGWTGGWRKGRVRGGGGGLGSGGGSGSGVGNSGSGAD